MMHAHASIAGFGQPHFNPAFFNQAQQGGGGGDWTPNKRQRQD